MFNFPVAGNGTLMNGTEIMAWQGRMQVVSTPLFLGNIDGSHDHDLLLTKLVSDLLIYALL